MKHWLEKAINRYLALDPDSEQRIAALRDKVVTVEIIGIPAFVGADPWVRPAAFAVKSGRTHGSAPTKATALTVQMLFSDKTIQLKWQDFSKPDLTIRSTPLNLLHMSLATPEKRHTFFAEDVVVEGNMELAQHVLAIFAELEIDWEEYISRWMGDAPAYQTGRFVRRLKKFSQTARQTFAEYINEYCHEEINLVPPVEALRDFFQEVDELRLDVDRLVARVEQLKQKIQDKP